MDGTVWLARAQIEEMLSRVGAKLARAHTLSTQAQQQMEASRQLLQQAQSEVSDLYISLSDILPD